MALAQVRFAPEFAIEDPTRIAEFQKRLGTDYLAQSQPVQPELDRNPLWLFRDGDRSWTVSLSNASLGLEAKTYHDFDDFSAELARVLNDAAEVFEPRTEVRLGVRYVNRIEDERLSKRGIAFFIQDELASPVGDLGGDLQHSLCELRFREGSGWLALRHGLIEPNVYLLDFDNFVEEERNFAPAEIVTRVNDFHGLIERLFAWSLSERYLNELKGSDG